MNIIFYNLKMLCKKADKQLANIEWTVWYIHAILEAEKIFEKYFFS